MTSFLIFGNVIGRRSVGMSLLCSVSLCALAQSEVPQRFQEAERTASYLVSNTIMMRLGQAPTVAQIRALDQIGAPVTVSVPPNVDPAQALRAHCGGSIATSYLNLVLEQNPSFRLGIESAERKLQVPPCPRYQVRPNTVVAPGDTLDSILVRNMGVYQDQTIEKCRTHSSRCLTTTASRVAANLNGGKDLQRPGALPVGATVTAPVRTEWSTISLKAGVSPDQAQRILQVQSAGAPIATQATPDLELIKPLHSSDAILANSSCDDASPLNANTWPYDESALEYALDRAIAAAKARGILKRTMVRIVDNGATGVETFFPPESLWSGSPDVPKDGTNPQGMGYYGFASGGRSTVEPLNGDPYGLHGTEVADIALGGYSFRDKYKAIYQIIGVDFVNVFKPLTNNMIEADPSTLDNSIVLKPPQAEILNISLGGVDSNPSFSQLLSSVPADSLLIVVAAGNDNVDLNDHRLYPAWNGGVNGVPSMMIVGAEQPDGTRAPFSNYGDGRVDILAPGCRFSLHTPEGEVNDVGTSFAAPLVTFTAAVSHGLGITQMSDVKKHIIASGDYSPLIGNKITILGTRLNVVRAVESLYDDVVTDKDGKDIVGKWQRPDTFRFCNDRDKMSTDDILRVDSLTDTNSHPALRILRDGLAHGISPPTVCGPGDGITLQTMDPATGQPRTTTFSWSDIRAFVPAHFRTDVPGANGSQTTTSTQ